METRSSGPLHSKEDSSGVTPLIGADGILRDDPKGKAEILNNQFTSVFSQISPHKLCQTEAQTLQDHTPISSPGSQITSLPTPVCLT